MKIKMLQTDKRICLTLLLVMNTALFILCANVFPIRFLTNDDVTMAWIANGVVTGTPDCHLIFMNALYGCFLNLLYGVAPNVEWYSVCFSVFHIVAISIIVAFFYNKIENKLIRWTVIVLYYLLWFRIIQFFQFTTTTAMLTFAAILLLLDGRYIIGGGGILLISSLLRFDAMGLVGLLSIPLFLYFYRFDLKKYVPVLVVLFIACGLHLTDKLFYQSPEWKEYCEYNHYRSVVNDSPNNWILNRSELPQNVSQENLQLLGNCNADPCQISNEDMKRLAEIINKTPFLNKCHNLPYTIMHYPFHKLYLGIFVLMFLLFLLSADAKDRKIFVALSFLFFMMVLWFISLDGNIKLRILESVCFVLFSFVLLLNFNQDSICNTKCFFAALPLVMVCGILVIHERACMETKNESNKEEQIKVVEGTGELQILNINHDFKSELLSPFSLYMTPRQKFVCGGWLTNAPLSPIKSFRETVDGNIGFFVSKNDSLTNFRKALRSNYAIETELQTIVESEHYAVVSLKSKSTVENKN